ncbi:choice-of-anchor I family protein [Kytococcus sedentarius]|uniref:choice-of-anchor I family protein n=1 Tax=Kytococcus sedentarius TaxID=1276 RepID=UPI0035BC013B
MSVLRPALALSLAAGALLTTPSAHAEGTLEMEVLSTHETGSFDEAASEIPAFDPTTGQVAVVNAEAGELDVLGLDERGQLSPAGSFSPVGLTAADGSVIGEGAQVNSVDVLPSGLAALAVEAPDKVSPGWVVLGRLTPGAFEPSSVVRVGAQPDMVRISPTGTHVLTADEGEPDDDFTVDPAGTVSVIDLSSGADAVTQQQVRTADFSAFATTLDPRVRVFGPDVPAPTGEPSRVERNLEPEYVAVDPSGTTAVVTLQEANALAIVDIASATVTDVRPMQQRSWESSAVDSSKEDERAHPIGGLPIEAMMQPDAIEAFTAGGQTYYVTANEGDVREWGEYTEETTIGELELAAFPDLDAEWFQSEEVAGDLKVSSEHGRNAETGLYEALYSFGGRSFSVVDAQGRPVFESGGQLEQIVLGLIEDGTLPEHAWNANHDENPSLDSRSDDKGVEPEAVAVGEVEGTPYLFLGLERISGIMVFDLSDPQQPQFVTWADNRGWDAEFDGEAVEGQGDLGPEGLEFVDAAASPTGEPLLVVGNEISGTTTVWSVTDSDGPIIDTGVAHQRAAGEGVGAALGLTLLAGGALVLAGRRQAVTRG